MALLNDDGKNSTSSTDSNCFKSLYIYAASSASSITTMWVLGCALKSDATTSADEDPLKPEIFKFGSSEEAHITSAFTCGC